MYNITNKEMMNREICQLIFKLRFRVTETKGNLKRKYDNLECRACINVEVKPRTHTGMCRNKEKQKTRRH